jgi:hypothetical protein
VRESRAVLKNTRLSHGENRLGPAREQACVTHDVGSARENRVW